MNFFHVHIGLRTFKTGLTVMLVMLVYHFIDRPAFVPALAAVFALRENWDNTMAFAKVRVISNVVGGGLAIIYYLIRQYTHNADWVSIILVPLLIMLGIIIHNKLDQSVGIVGGMAAFLMIALTIPMDATIDYVFLRVLDVFVGVLFAMVVNRFAMPDEIKKVEVAAEKVETDVKKAVHKIDSKHHQD
ncbi:FUSC family protein [Fructobacillus durionis]|uniref:Aromatic acid exporter family member 1 n=1 Tax=Fructobacillus durionis TaxID=283737 RepID=A0A1I1GAQ2_9LACO|nr:Aromatic acid exporter family member 1 [Fructobacillus durionis]